MDRIISLLSIATATVVLIPNPVDAFCCSSSSGSSSIFTKTLERISPSLRKSKSSSQSVTGNADRYSRSSSQNSDKRFAPTKLATLEMAKLLIEKCTHSNFDEQTADKFISIYYKLYEKLYRSTPDAVREFIYAMQGEDIWRGEEDRGSTQELHLSIAALRKHIVSQEPVVFWTSEFWESIRSLSYFNDDGFECSNVNRVLPSWCQKGGKEWVSSKSAIAKSWANKNPDVDVDFFIDVEDELSKVCGITFRLYILGEVKGRCAYTDPKEKTTVETLKALLSNELTQTLAAIKKSLERKCVEAKKLRDSSSSLV